MWLTFLCLPKFTVRIEEPIHYEGATFLNLLLTFSAKHAYEKSAQGLPI